MYIYKKFKNAQRKADKLGLTVAEYGEIYGEEPRQQEEFDEVCSHNHAEFDGGH